MLKQLDHPSRYSDANTQKATGSHFTPSELANFVAEEIYKYASLNCSRKIRILDPAIGDGELILALLDVLKDKKLDLEIIGFDTNQDSLSDAKLRVEQHQVNVNIDLRQEDFLDFVVRFQNQSLFERVDFPLVDIVISNPPYVRTQVLGNKKSQMLAKAFGLSGRVDLAYAFLKAFEWVLCSNGVAGVIVSNRFMTTKAGAVVRKNLKDSFHIRHVWDMGDTRFFEAAVLPAVLILERKGSQDNKHDEVNFSSIYSTDSPVTHDEVFPSIIASLSHSGIVEVDGGQRFEVKHGQLAKTGTMDGVWRISTNESHIWLKQVSQHTYCKFGELGKIRVGVKTTADKVFIRDDWHTLEGDPPELLKPIITHHIGRRYCGEKPQKQILYTHEVLNGKRRAIKLDQYPNAARYLESKRDVLKAREYVAKARRNWYEVWVPQDPSKWLAPKLIFRDIVDKPTFWIDFSGAVVNGDCYWLCVKNPSKEPLLWLALAVANSTFIEEFYDCRFNNKLYAGRRRYITQYVKEFPLPDPNSELASEIIGLCKTIYHKCYQQDTSIDEKTLDNLIWSAFGF